MTQVVTVAPNYRCYYSLCDAKLILHYSTRRQCQVGGANRSSGGPGADIQVEISISWQSDGNGAPTELTAAATSWARRPGLPGHRRRSLSPNTQGSSSGPGPASAAINGRASSLLLPAASRAVRISNSAAGSHHRRSQGTDLPNCNHALQNVPVAFESSRTDAYGFS